MSTAPTTAAAAAISPLHLDLPSPTLSITYSALHTPVMTPYALNDLPVPPLDQSDGTSSSGESMRTSAELTLGGDLVIGTDNTLVRDEPDPVEEDENLLPTKVAGIPTPFKELPLSPPNSSPPATAKKVSGGGSTQPTLLRRVSSAFNLNYTSPTRRRQRTASAEGGNSPEALAPTGPPSPRRSQTDVMDEPSPTKPGRSIRRASGFFMSRDNSPSRRRSTGWFSSNSNSTNTTAPTSIMPSPVATRDSSRDVSPVRDKKTKKPAWGFGLMMTKMESAPVTSGKVETPGGVDMRRVKTEKVEKISRKKEKERPKVAKAETMTTSAEAGKEKAKDEEVPKMEERPSFSRSATLRRSFSGFFGNTSQAAEAKKRRSVGLKIDTGLSTTPERWPGFAEGPKSTPLSMGPVTPQYELDDDEDDDTIVQEGDACLLSAKPEFAAREFVASERHYLRGLLMLHSIISNSKDASDREHATHIQNCIMSSRKLLGLIKLRQRANPDGLKAAICESLCECEEQLLSHFQAYVRWYARTTKGGLRGGQRRWSSTWSSASSARPNLRTPGNSPDKTPGSGEVSVERTLSDKQRERKEKREKEMERLTVADFCVSPVQRVGRYSLLLQEMRKKCEETEEETEMFDKALETAEHLAGASNVAAAFGALKK
ncbi:hypothetical protein YB2330_003064 [Saitoella coloradoensis]